MFQILSSDNLVSETTSTKTKKEKIQFKNFIQWFIRNVFHVDNDPEDHFNEVDPEKGKINRINDQLNLVSLSFVVDKNIN
jgi:hypothetical protein